MVPRTVRPGDRVHVHYTSSNEDGGVFETSGNRKPLSFTAGGGDVIEGVSHGVIGMRLNEEKRLTVLPEYGFGFHDPYLQQTVPREMLPDNLEEGSQLRAVICDTELDVWVRRINDEEVILDANHPLAGEVMVFDLEVVAIDEADVVGQ